jgi:membrane-bound lytic murein transglycosylase B
MRRWRRNGFIASRCTPVLIAAALAGVAHPALALDAAGPTTTTAKPAAAIVPAPTTTVAALMTTTTAPPPTTTTKPPAPVTTTAPGPTTTVPGASIILRSDATTTTTGQPKTTILSVTDPTTTTTSTTRPPSTAPGPQGPGTAEPLVRSTGTGSFSRVLRLLETAAAGPGPFDAALADAERTQDRLRSELSGAVRQLADAGGAVETTRAGVATTEEALWRLDAAPVTMATTTTSTVPASSLAASPPTLTTIPRSAPAATQPPVTVAAPVDPKLAPRLDLTTRLQEQKRAVAQAETHAEEARQAHLAAAGAAEGADQVVATLRAQLWSKMNDPTFRTAARVLVAAAGAQVEPSTLAAADVPAPMLALYRRNAATCPGLSWTVLAAIGSVESNHGRANLPGVRTGANFAGAMGPMQFLAPTWARYGADGDSDGDSDVYDPADAVRGAAGYLCANGAGGLPGLPDALWAYNHAGWYVDEVLTLALRYGSDGLSAEAASAPETVSAATLVASPNLELTAQARADLLAGKADPRVVRSLAAAVASGHKLAVSVIETGHSMYVAGTTRVSNHYYGRAVDIYAIDGVPVSATNDAALEVALAVLTAAPELRPDEFGSPWPELSPFPGAFSDADHVDHLHLGWGPRQELVQPA